MNQKEFNILFGTNKKCIEHFRNIRQRKGLKCNKCGGNRHYWAESNLAFICKNSKCRNRIGIKSGTIMMHSNLPIQKWYEIIYHMTRHHDDKPTTQIQRAIGATRYESIWYTVQKIRLHMRKSNENLSMSYFDVLTKGEKPKRKNHSKIPNGCRIRFNANKIQLVYARHDNHVKHLTYRCPKIIDLPSEILISTSLNLKKKSFHDSLILRDLVYKLHRIHRNVSDYFIQLYFDQFCFIKNNKSKENLFEIFLESST